MGFSGIRCLTPVEFLGLLYVGMLERFMSKCTCKCFLWYFWVLSRLLLVLFWSKIFLVSLVFCVAELFDAAVPALSRSVALVYFHCLFSLSLKNTDDLSF